MNCLKLTNLERAIGIFWNGDGEGLGLSMEKSMDFLTTCYNPKVLSSLAHL